MVSGHRTYLRVGGFWLLFASAVHAAGHWFTFVDRRAMDEAQVGPVDQLRSTPGGEEIWILFLQFSVAFTLFLLLAGTASVIASRRSVPRREARHWAGFAGAFWILAFALFLLEPAPPGLIISGAAAFFHVAAFFSALPTPPTHQVEEGAEPRGHGQPATPPVDRRGRPR